MVLGFMVGVISWASGFIWFLASWLQGLFGSWLHGWCNFLGFRVYLVLGFMVGVISWASGFIWFLASGLVYFLAALNCV